MTELFGRLGMRQRADAILANTLCLRRLSGHPPSADTSAEQWGASFRSGNPSRKALIGCREQLPETSTKSRPNRHSLRMKTLLIFLSLCVMPAAVSAAGPSGTVVGQVVVPIFVYHRFGARVTDSMTVTDDTFSWQLQYLKTHGYTVIPLSEVVNYLRGTSAPPPVHSIVITADDGHRSVYSDMLPIVRRYGIHVTLFLYPSAISNASYAMTWTELAELAGSGLFDMQSHTYWHPNFHKDKARLTPPQYDAFVDMQLQKSKQVLESRLGVHVDLLAWPFGIYDEDLMARARMSRYVAALSIERRPATKEDPLMALPRYLMSDGDRDAVFIRLLEERPALKAGPRPTR